MDMISQLPDEMLLRILSFLPTTNDVVETMVLAKRWQFLWMWVPRLVYDDSFYVYDEDRRIFRQFVDRSLLMHEAPVIESLRFKLGKICDADDIQVWIRAANKCSVREQIIEIDSSSRRRRIILPRSLYTGCRMLVTLKLDDVVLNDFSSSVPFPSLKTLSLLSVMYPGDEFVKSLLSSCPVLEDLEVEQCPHDNVTIFTVIVPSLKSLKMRKKFENRVEGEAHGLVIDAPSLKHLDIADHKGEFCIIENDMPKIEGADIDVAYSHTEHILGSITSVRRLYLCLSISKDAYPVGSIFHQLVYLWVCTCQPESLNLLMRMLKDSPKLKYLKLRQYHNLPDLKSRLYWKEPSSVPECLLSSLETVEWIEYEGTEEEKELVVFILRTGSCLKEVTIHPRSTSDVKTLRMIQELTSAPRRSPTCQLFFVDQLSRR